MSTAAQFLFFLANLTLRTLSGTEIQTTAFFPGFEDGLNLIARYSDLSSDAINLDHLALFPVSLNGDTPAVFKNQSILSQKD